MTVRRVVPGEIQVGRETLSDNVVLTADRGIERWSGTGVENLSPEDFAAIIESRPEIVVLGTGWRQVFPPKALVYALARRGIGFEFMDTPAACRTFNILINEGRRAVAVLMLH